MPITAVTTPYSPSPYLTIADLRAAPTRLDLDNLVPYASHEQQDVELANVILRASSWIDTLCNQVLSATVDTEVGVLRANRYGEITVHTSFWPVREVRDFRYGPAPNNQTALMDFTSVFIERMYFTITANSFLTSSVGPLQFGGIRADAPLYCQWTYVNGWANTTLAQSAQAGDTSIVVADATGLYGSLPSRPTIADRDQTETVTVSSVSGTTVELASPLRFSHTPTEAEPIAVSELPAAVKQAAIAVASALIKAPGDTAIVLQQIASGGPRKMQGADADDGIDLLMADELLIPYRRVA